MRFDALSRNVTQRYYTQLMGESAEHAKLQTVDELLSATRAHHEAGQALREVFGPVLLPVRAMAIGPLPIIPVNGVDEGAAVETLRARIRERHETASAARASMQRFDGIDAQLAALESQIGAAEIRATVPGQAGAGEELATLRVSRRQTIADASVAARAVDRYLHAAAQRISQAIVLSRSEAAARLNAPDLEPILNAMAALQAHEAELQALRARLLGLHSAVVDVTSNLPDNLEAVNAVKNATQVLANHLHKIRTALAAPYPFEHASGTWSVGVFLVERVPSAGDIGEVLQAAQLALTRAFETYIRLLAHVCWRVRQVERVMVPDAPAHPLLEDA
jgi:hypothetical protein